MGVDYKEGLKNICISLISCVLSICISCFFYSFELYIASVTMAIMSATFFAICIWSAIILLFAFLSEHKDTLIGKSYQKGEERTIK